jgi:hypothetical protein
VTRQLHVVNGRNTHPGFGASLEGWAACDDAGVPWNSSAEELMEREELHPSIEALLRAVGEDGEFVARINPDAELPSSRRLHTKQGMPSPQPLLELSAQPNPNARHSSLFPRVCRRLGCNAPIPPPRDTGRACATAG